jgi:RNA-binding protein
MVAANPDVYSGFDVVSRNQGSSREPPMPLSTKQRKDLLARSHPLKPAVIVNANAELSDTVVEQVRSAFTSHEVIKVRIAAETGAATDTIATELAARVPCELVRRVGRILILYRSNEPPATA